MLQYVQVERQIHIDFTDDVLLVMQARSDGNDDEKIVESSLGFYSFLSDLFSCRFHGHCLSKAHPGRMYLSFYFIYDVTAP